MANFGIGLGAFMSGVAQGANTMRSIQRGKKEDELFDLKIQDYKQDAADKQALRATNEAAVSDANAARSSAISSSITAGTNERGLPSWSVGGKTFDSEDEARKAAEGQVGSFMDFYMQKGAPRIMEGFLKAGQPEKAKAFETWMQDAEVKRGIRSWAGAARAATQGDAEGFLKHMKDAYNNPSYMNSGDAITGSRVLKDDKGNVTGMELVFKGEDGNERTQTFNGMEDIYREGLNLMAPEKVLEFGIKRMEDAQKLRVELAKEGYKEKKELAKEKRAEERDIRRENRAVERKDIETERTQQFELEKQAHASLLREAEALAKTSGKAAGMTPEKIGNALQTIIRDRAASDFNFAKLPYEKQLELASKDFDARSAAAQSKVGGPTPQRNPGRTIPVWPGN